MARLLPVINYLRHDCFCLFVARILLASQPASQQPANQPASQPVSSQPAASQPAASNADAGRDGNRNGVGGLPLIENDKSEFRVPVV